MRGGVERKSIVIVEDIRECFGIDGNIKILSLTDLGAIYFGKIFSNIYCASDFLEFEAALKINKLCREDLETFKNIYEYEELIVCESYYARRLCEKIKDIGLTIRYQKGKKDINESRVLDMTFVAGKNRDKISIIDLIKICEFIEHYREISGEILNKYIYIEAEAEYIKKLKYRGYEMILNNKNRFRISLLISILEHLVYEKAKKTCDNIYVYIMPPEDIFPTNPDYFPQYFCDNKEFFGDDFVEDMYGDSEYPLEKIIRDNEDCKMLYINKKYLKFLSNYHSENFNTNVYGNRVVSEQPDDYNATIWLAGWCNFCGYAVDDKHTPASLLQKHINACDYKYRVEDLSASQSYIFRIYDKLMEGRINRDDVLILGAYRWLPDKDVIEVDYKPIVDYKINKIWYWNTFWHPSQDVYDIVGKTIFSVIEKRGSKISI